MKTIREWADHLPEPIRTQFLENAMPKLLDSKEPNVYEAIRGGFVWIGRPQGANYWAKICDRAKNGEFDQPMAHPMAHPAMTVLDLLAKIDKQIAELKAKQAELEAMPMSIETIEPLHNATYDAIRLEILKKQIEKLCNS